MSWTNAFHGVQQRVLNPRSFATVVEYSPTLAESSVYNIDTNQHYDQQTFRGKNAAAKARKYIDERNPNRR